MLILIFHINGKKRSLLKILSTTVLRILQYTNTLQCIFSIITSRVRSLPGSFILMNRERIAFRLDWREQGSQTKNVFMTYYRKCYCSPTYIILRKSPNSGIAYKIRISATPTNVYDRTYIVLHVYNSNFEKPIRFLVTITIKRRLAV
jgi:hypothetical protein